MTVGPPAALSVCVASRNVVKINAIAAAVKRAFPVPGNEKHHVVGADSQSGVPDQPFGDDETLRGACNRLASILPQHRGCLLVAIEGGVGYQTPLPLAAGLDSDRGPTAVDVAIPRQQPSQSQQQQEYVQQAQAWQPQLGDQQPQQGEQRQQWKQGPQQLPGLECFAWVVVQAPSGATSHARTASFPLPPAVSELMLRNGLELGDADDAVFGRSKSGQGSGTIGQLTGGLITRQSYYEHAALCALVPLINPQLYPGFEQAAGREDE